MKSIPLSAHPAVVITGSTRGLGFALAREFALRGCRVTVSGRSAQGVEITLSRLLEAAAGALEDADVGAKERFQGHPCDVSDPEQVRGLWEAAVERWGRVDIWINNAGVGQSYLPVWELDQAQARQIVETNLLGVIYGCRTAIKGMRQQGVGQIYNLEGWGSDGKRRNALTVYGTTKRAVRYFTRGLADELEGESVRIGTLSPGMMVTDFLTAPMENMEDAEPMRRIVNILGDPPHTVARYLVRKILSNKRNHAHFVWLTTVKILGRFLVAPFRKRDLFADTAERRD